MLQRGQAVEAHVAVDEQILASPSELTTLSDFAI
jgi:hypothetical protein